MVDADAEGAGLAEEKVFEGGDLRVVGEDGEEGAEAALFHLNGGGHDVESAEGEGAFGDVGEDLGGEIVDGGFEDGDGGVGGVGGFADAEAEDVGEVFGVASAGAVADLLDAHGGLGAEGGSESADEGGAGGGDELFFDVGGVGGEAAEEVGGGGCGDGEAAVGAVDHAAADVEWGAEPLVDGEGVDAGGGGDDVDDGVDCAYFVEVDFFDGDVVDFGFGGAEEFEGVDGGLFDGGGEGCGVDQVADDGEGAAVGVFVADGRDRGCGRFCAGAGFWGGAGGCGFAGGRGRGLRLRGMRVRFLRLGCCAFVDVNFCGGDSAAVDLFDFEGGVEIQGGGGFVEDVGIDSGVDEGSEEHVAADAGEAVEVGDAHGVIVSRAAGLVGERGDCEYFTS